MPRVLSLHKQEHCPCKRDCGNWVRIIHYKGTATVKENNFTNHVKKSQTHTTAVLRLAEDEKLSQCTSANTCSTLGTASGAPKQSTLLPYLQKLSAHQSRFMGKCCRLRKVYTTSIWVQATTVIVVREHMP